MLFIPRSEHSRPSLQGQKLEAKAKAKKFGLKAKAKARINIPGILGKIITCIIY